MHRSNYIPVKVTLFNGSIMMRGLRDLDHGTLCAAFSFDPCSTWFDLPSTFRGVGSNMGQTFTGRREIDGLIFQGPKGSEPIGKLKITYAGDRDGSKFDDDPFNKSDFYNFNR